MRLEPEIWDALREICARERVGISDLVKRVDEESGNVGRTSAMRVYVFCYFLNAATEEGHLAAGHGPLVSGQT